jgi:hypothetical protein
VWTASVRCGHGRGVQRDHVPAITDGAAEAVGEQFVPGDDDPAGGGDVDELATDRTGHHHPCCGQFGRHRIAVAAVGHQRLARGGALLGHDHRIRLHRNGLQRLGVGEDGNGAAALTGGPHPGITTCAAKAVEVGLGLLGCDIVGQGAPPALRGSVIGLLHHTLAVAAPRRAHRHRDRIVFGHPGEGGGDPPRARITHRRHPVEPPRLGHPAQGPADPVQALHQVRLIGHWLQRCAPLARMGQRPDQQMRRAAPPPRRRWIRQIQPVPLGFVSRRMLDDRVGPVRRRPAFLAHRPQPTRPDVTSQARIRQREPEPFKLIAQRARPQMRVLAQPGAHVVNERCERVLTGRFAHPGCGHAVDVICGSFGDSCRCGGRSPRSTTPADAMRVSPRLPLV